MKLFASQENHTENQSQSTYVDTIVITSTFEIVLNTNEKLRNDTYYWLKEYSFDLQDPDTFIHSPALSKLPKFHVRDSQIPSDDTEITLILSEPSFANASLLIHDLFHEGLFSESTMNLAMTHSDVLRNTGKSSC